MTRQEIIRDLGEGLVLRRASAADAEALAAFNADLHRDEGTAQPDEGIAVWTRDLLLRPHPTMSAGGVTVVEDRRSGAIVSSLSLIPQTWAYAGREFGVGRMELVGTNSGYRQRGLVRAQFAVAHAWSAARGQAAQIVTGIPYFYRQFGYEMVLTLGAGRAGSKLDVPALKEGETEPYMVRPATAADAPFIARTYAAGQRRHLVRDVRSAAVWRYEIEGHSRVGRQGFLGDGDADGTALCLCGWRRLRQAAGRRNRRPLLLAGNRPSLLPGGRALPAGGAPSLRPLRARGRPAGLSASHRSGPGGPPAGGRLGGPRWGTEAGLLPLRLPPGLRRRQAGGQRTLAARSGELRRCHLSGPHLLAAALRLPRPLGAGVRLRRLRRAGGNQPRSADGALSQTGLGCLGAHSSAQTLLYLASSERLSRARP